MYGSCHQCGGPHFKADCPQLQQARTLQEQGWDNTAQASDDHYQYGNVKEFASAVQAVEPKTEVKTPGPPDLEASDSEDDEDETWAQVVTKKRRKKEKRAAKEAAREAEEEQERRAKMNGISIWQQKEEDEEGEILTKMHMRINRQKRKRGKKFMKYQECPDECCQPVNLLQTIAPENVSELTCIGEWEVIELAVDSGATETVMSEDCLRSVETIEGEASKRGIMYEVANGVQIPNLGEKKFVGISEEGVARGLKAQIAEVNKGLLSVAKVVKNGNRVVFDDQGSYIEDKETHERMWLEERQGMYMLKMWVKSPGFHRRG